MSSTEVTTLNSLVISGSSSRNEESIVTFRLGRQLCGLPILCVRDILAYKEIFRIPLSLPEVLGAINIRGRIVTVLDLSLKLGLKKSTEAKTGFCLITEYKGEAYGLRVDEIGDITNVSEDIFEPPPSQLNVTSQYINGVYRTEGELLLRLDHESLLSFDDTIDHMEVA